MVLASYVFFFAFVFFLFVWFVDFKWFFFSTVFLVFHFFLSFLITFYVRASIKFEKKNNKTKSLQATKQTPNRNTSTIVLFIILMQQIKASIVSYVPSVIDEFVTVFFFFFSNYLLSYSLFVVISFSNFVFLTYF